MKYWESKKATPVPGVSTENKYKEGEFVSERVHPYRKLKIIRYSHRIYYCRIIARPDQADLALAEREIMPTK